MLAQAFIEVPLMNCIFLVSTKEFSDAVKSSILSNAEKKFIILIEMMISGPHEKTNCVLECFRSSR